MNSSKSGSRLGLGLSAPTQIFVAIVACLMNAAPVSAQQQEQRQGAIRQAPLDMLTASRLVWSTMAALHHANVTGNYTVLRDLGTQSFQANNNPARLIDVFQALRTSGVDVSAVLLIPPVYEISPAVAANGTVRMRGAFPIRPTGVAFDLIFQNISGSWRILGISAVPVSIVQR